MSSNAETTARSFTAQILPLSFMVLGRASAGFDPLFLYGGGRQLQQSVRNSLLSWLPNPTPGSPTPSRTGARGQADAPLTRCVTTLTSSTAERKKGTGPGSSPGSDLGESPGKAGRNGSGLETIVEVCRVPYHAVTHAETQSAQRKPDVYRGRADIERPTESGRSRPGAPLRFPTPPKPSADSASLREKCLGSASPYFSDRSLSINVRVDPSSSSRATMPTASSMRESESRALA